MRFLIITAFLFALTAIVPTQASEYEISNIAVDVEGKTAIDARNLALIKARRDAFNILTGRLLTKEEATSLPVTDDLTIANMVSDFEINREKLSKNRYLGNISINFNPQAVRGYLGRYTNVALIDTQNLTNIPGAGINATATTRIIPQQVGKRLILPWYGEDTDITLWRDTNPWRQAWDTWLLTPQAAQSGLTMPIGDITDMQYFNPQKPLNFDAAGLDKLLQRYGASEAIIAMADPLPNGMVRVSLYQSTNMMPRFIERFVVPSSNMSGANQYLPAIYKSVSSIQNIGEVPLTTANEDIAIADTSSFARDNTINTPFEAEVQIANLPQWIGIKQALGKIIGISDMQVKSLSANRAILEFRYTGDSESLRQALTQQGLNIYANPQQMSGASPFIITRQQG